MKVSFLRRRQRSSTPELGEEEPSVPIFDTINVQRGDIILVSDRFIFDYAPSERVAAWFESGVRDGLSWASSSTRDSAVVAAFEAASTVIVDQPAETGDLMRSY